MEISVPGGEINERPQIHTRGDGPALSNEKEPKRKFDSRPFAKFAATVAVICGDIASAEC
jgi:hypothetical protein